MDVMNLGLSALATISVLAVVPLLALLQQRLAGHSMSGLWPGIVLSAGLGGLVALAFWASGVSGIPALIAGPITGLGALFASVATSPLRYHSRLVQGLFSAISTGLVFLPASVAVFGSAFDFLFTSAGLIDLGASLPEFVAAGSVGIGAFVFQRRSEVTTVRMRWWPVVSLIAALWFAWIGWLVGLELAIDDSTSTIVLNAILMPVVGVIAGLAVERIRHRSTTPRGLALGFLGGAIAAAATCAFLEPTLAVITAMIAGGLSTLLTPSSRGAGAKAILATALIAGGSSLLLLGFFAKDLAFIYTGQPEVFFGQLAAVAASAVLGFLVGATLWWLLRRLDGSQRSLPRR
ncbi:hypothetical protein [Glaciihabitans sp. UYNi722]|uniref:hypothetical protein n=1 Tax=Glaciihabitans sp. UYNi722 TaxID=3156344 RepID=UPI0033970315